MQCILSLRNAELLSTYLCPLSMLLGLPFQPSDHHQSCCCCRRLCPHIFAPYPLCLGYFSNHPTIIRTPANTLRWTILYLDLSHFIHHISTTIITIITMVSIILIITMAATLGSVLRSLLSPVLARDLMREGRGGQFSKTPHYSYHRHHHHQRVLSLSVIQTWWQGKDKWE